MHDFPRRLGLSPRLARYAGLGLLAATAMAPSVGSAAGPHALLPPQARPATWDDSLEVLRSKGLGQYRGAPIPVPANAPLRPANDPARAKQGVVFVNFDGAQLSSGLDDSRTNVTQIGNLVGTFAPYGEGDKRVAVLQAVAADWADYNVLITQTRPASGDYTMNMTGPTNPFGNGVLGIAPLDCDDAQTHNNITYAFHAVNDDFSAAITATTIGQEVAHSYGLEHVDQPNDIMNPYNAGGDPSFTDTCIAIVQGGQCGAQHEAHCGSAFAQNAHQELLALFGPGIPDTVVPVVSIVSPTDGEEFPAGADFDIEVVANDVDGGIQQVRLFNNGTALQVDTSEPYGWSVGNAPAGSYDMYVEATDLAGNVAVSNTVVIYVGVSADEGQDTGAQLDGETAGDGDGNGSGGTAAADTEGANTAGADQGDGGCACRTTAGGAGRGGWWLLLGLLPAVARRRRGARESAAH